MSIERNGSLADLFDGETASQAKARRESRRTRQRRAECLHTVVCDICGEPFETTRKDAKRHPAKDPTHDCYWRWASHRGGK